MPVMPDISAHWLAGWRTRVQQLLYHDQSCGQAASSCPLFCRQTLSTLFLELCLTLVLHACCSLLGLGSFKVFFQHSYWFIKIWKPFMNPDKDLNLRVHCSAKESTTLCMLSVCACTQVPCFTSKDLSLYVFSVISKPLYKGSRSESCHSAAYERLVSVAHFLKHF